MKHDYVYWQKGASGIKGALYGKNVIYADIQLVNDASAIMKGYWKGSIDPVTKQPITFRTYSVVVDVYVAFQAVLWFKF